MAIHADGGFKTAYKDEGGLTNKLQESVNGVVANFEKRSDFKAGLVVIVGCGWGKGLRAPLRIGDLLEDIV